MSPRKTRLASTRLTKCITGNHDLSLDPNYHLKDEHGWKVIPDETEKCRELVKSMSGVVYLQHEATTIDLPRNDVSFCVFGSPYSPDRGRGNWAFQYSDEQATALWGAIPTKTDVLITHTPAAGLCDTSLHWHEGGFISLGSALWRAKPSLQICGHCHEGRGAEVVRWGANVGEVDSVRHWEDLSIGTKKQSLFDLTGKRNGFSLDVEKETAIVNASVKAKSWDGSHHKIFNKPIVVDVQL